MPFIRSFTATPRIILNDSNCSSTDKLILGIINSLSYNKEYCYASNSYFAKELSLGTKTISNSLSRLKKQKYIIIKYVDGKRRIYLDSEIVSKANANVVEKNFQEPMEENYYHNRRINNRKNKRNNVSPIMSKDIDGVELWNGKRCEPLPLSPEEEKEMQEIMKDFMQWKERCLWLEESIYK